MQAIRSAQPENRASASRAKRPPGCLTIWKSRLGAPKAITATAHKLARLVYSLLKHGTAYMTQGREEYEQRYRERVLQNLSRRAKELGCELVQPAAPAPEVALL